MDKLISAVKNIYSLVAFILLLATSLLLKLKKGEPQLFRNLAVVFIGGLLIISFWIIFKNLPMTPPPAQSTAAPKELSPQPKQAVNGTADRGGIVIQGGQVGQGTGGNVEVIYGPITKVYTASPRQVLPNIPPKTSGQQYPPDNRQPHVPAIDRTSLRGKIVFADGIAEQFDTLQASSKSGPYILETYNRDPSGLKQSHLDLRRISQLTLGENVRIGEAYYITLQVLYKGGGEENAFVKLNDTLGIAKAGSPGNYKELSKIERITFE